MKRMLSAREFSHFADGWHLAPVLDAGEFIFLSGVMGSRPELSVSPDPETQFRDAFKFLAVNLQAAGLDFQQAVEVTTYHVG